MDFDLRAHTHLLVVAGSRAHGLHTPASDLDLKGVAVPPRRYVLGMAHRFEQADEAEQFAVFLPDLPREEQAIAARTGVEGTVYELRKFLTLATSANPNALEALFCREQEVRRASAIGAALRDHREIFLSARCVQTFAGYAAQQLSRIRLHYRWHHAGPERAPTRADFGLPEVTLLPKEQLAAAEAAIHKQLDSWELDLSGLEPAERTKILGRVARSLAEQGLASDEARWEAAARWVGLDDNLVEVMKRERSYRGARGEWRRYQTWKKRRNPERAALEARFGYDTKHGAHLVRLLRMGLEIGTEGRCIVWRGERDAEELRAIRAGAWPYEQLVAWAEAKREALQALDALAVPARPDRDAIDTLCVQLVEQALGLSD